MRPWPFLPVSSQHRVPGDVEGAVEGRQRRKLARLAPRTTSSSGRPSIGAGVYRASFQEGERVDAKLGVAIRQGRSVVVDHQVCQAASRARVRDPA